MKFFNTAGPVNQDNHYKIPPLHRWDQNYILELIDQQKYFVLHAPRQSGKTSTLLALQDYLNERDDYIAVYANVEAGQVARNDIDRGIKAILSNLKNRVIKIIGHKKEINQLYQDALRDQAFEDALNDFLQEICQIAKKPIVLLIDEIDSLVGDTLISVLRQLRSGYDERPYNFPASVILCGLTDIKDYKIHRSDGEIITGGSCFNIKAEPFTLANFSFEQIKKLYAYHTKETGQTFENSIFDLAFDYTAGQPWLVNALAYEVCFKMEKGRDRSKEITVPMFKKAKQNLILSHATHLDQLSDKLKEDRVRRVLEPMFTDFETKFTNDDVEYCIDLGLIKKSKEGLVISNTIYKEVLPRELSKIVQTKFLSLFRPEWVNDDETINNDKLMTMFQQFWRENSDIWSKDIAGYQEAAPHLVFQGFLQRVANGHGDIDREYGLSKKRSDLFLRWNGPKKEQRIVFELKLRTDRYNSDESFEKLKNSGLKQTAEYADICNAEISNLIIFDRREGIDWKDKVFLEESEYGGYKIKIWGM